MSIFQSDWAKIRRQAPTADCAGDVVSEKFDFTVTANVGTTDIIELGILPAGHTVVDATLITDDLGAGTIDVGLMSGTVGSTDAARTSGNELFAAAADNSVVRLSQAGAFSIAPSDVHRSIGVKVSAAVTAANQKISLVLSYRA